MIGAPPRRRPPNLLIEFCRGLSQPKCTSRQLVTFGGPRIPRPRKPASPFRYFTSSPEVIRLLVMMYVRFPLSLRNVEDLLFERGIEAEASSRSVMVGRHEALCRHVAGAYSLSETPCRSKKLVRFADIEFSECVPSGAGGWGSIVEGSHPPCRASRSPPLSGFPPLPPWPPR